MSQESSSWLNQNVLIGLTDKRGKAWHWRESEQGTEPNHYPSFIPADDVIRRLFDFEAIEPQAAYLLPVESNVVGSSRPTIWIGNQQFYVVIDAEHKAVVDKETGVVFNYPTVDWAKHSFGEWLIDVPGQIIDISKGELGISSAGLLRRRAQAWVEISIPENIETPEGVTFRPNLLAGTSYDSSFATFYKRTLGFTVCDNTFHCNRNGQGEEFRLKHTLNSGLRIAEARQALNLIYSAADEFQRELTEFCATPVSEYQWQSVLDALLPRPEKLSIEKPGRSWSLNNNKREKIDELYHFDERCAPWKGNKFGVVQTLNTWKTHEATVRNTNGGGRAERYQLRNLGGEAEAFDNLVIETVDKVLASA